MMDMLMDALSVSYNFSLYLILSHCISLYLIVSNFISFYLIVSHCLPFWNYPKNPPDLNPPWYRVHSEKGDLSRCWPESLSLTFNGIVLDESSLGKHRVYLHFNFLLASPFLFGWVPFSSLEKIAAIAERSLPVLDSHGTSLHGFHSRFVQFKTFRLGKRPWRNVSFPISLFLPEQHTSQYSPNPISSKLPLFSYLELVTFLNP